MPLNYYLAFHQLVGRTTEDIVKRGANLLRLVRRSFACPNHQRELNHEIDDRRKIRPVPKLVFQRVRSPSICPQDVKVQVESDDDERRHGQEDDAHEKRFVQRLNDVADMQVSLF